MSGLLLRCSGVPVAVPVGSLTPGQIACVFGARTPEPPRTLMTRGGTT